MYLQSAEDPLDQLGSQAVRVTLNTSCQNVKYLDFSILKYLVDSIKKKKTIISVSNSLKNILKKATDEQLERISSSSVITFSICHKSSIEEKSIPEDIFRNYIIIHKNTVLKSGHEYATQVYGISYRESVILNSISSFLDNIRYDSYTIRIRCSENILKKMIECTDTDSLKRLKLKKIQQCLSEKETSKPNCTYSSAAPAYDSTTESGRSNIDQSKKLLARKMFISGYAVSTISLELGLSARQCRLVYEHVKESDYLDAADENGKIKVITTRHAVSVLKYSYDIINASILMRLYSNIGGDAVKNHTRIFHLNIAYALLCSIRHDIYGLAERHNRRISIQDAWTLAVDLRSGLGYFRICKSCTSKIYCTPEQNPISTACVFCHSNDTDILYDN